MAPVSGSLNVAHYCIVMLMRQSLSLLKV